MKLVTIRFIFLLVLFCNLSGHAQSGASIVAIQDTLPMALSPSDSTRADFHISKFSPTVKVTGAVLAGASLWIATYAWIDEPLQKHMQSHRAQTLDAVARVVEPMGRQRLFLPITGTAALVGFALGNPNLRKVGSVSFTSLLITGGLTGLIKNQVHRYRPSETDENHFYDWGMAVSENTSFPSSHTTVAFAVATSVASVYGKEHPLIPPLAYGTATLVGLSRINDNAHWATDIMAGAALGYVSAKGSLLLYNLAERKLKKGKGKLTAVPNLGSNSASFYFSLTF
jgi:hypothetical protein